MGDRQQAVGVADAVAAAAVDRYGQHVCVETGEGDLMRDRVLALVPGAERVAVDVGLHLAQGVGDVADEAG